MHIQSPHNIDNREHKIRIVERLSNVSSALQSDVITMNAMNQDGVSTSSAQTITAMNTGEAPIVDPLSPRFRLTASPNTTFSDTINGTVVGSDYAGATDQWLDDAQLALMSTTDLEKLTERYLMSVVKQLVQLASVDDDLRTELDALDSSGLSLLHYCCLYNLTALVPVLMARGASVEQRTSLPSIGEVDASLPAVESTALHLAASAGHLAIVQMLVSNSSANNSTI
jgi:hypothetical protein